MQNHKLFIILKNIKSINVKNEKTKVKKYFLKNDK
jgi:hypothetical protein